MLLEWMCVICFVCGVGLGLYGGIKCKPRKVSELPLGFGYKKCYGIVLEYQKSSRQDEWNLYYLKQWLRDRYLKWCDNIGWENIEKNNSMPTVEERQ